MDDLLAEFIAELRDMLEALSGEIVAWEADPADRARLDRDLPLRPTVKGNCGFFELPRLEALSHAAEECSPTCAPAGASADTALVSAVLAVIDRIGEIVDAIVPGATIPASDDAADRRAREHAEEPAAPRRRRRRAKRGSPPRPRTIRLPVDLLDRMMSGVSDMVAGAQRTGPALRACRTEAGPRRRSTASR